MNGYFHLSKFAKTVLPFAHALCEKGSVIFNYFSHFQLRHKNFPMRSQFLYLREKVAKIPINSTGEFTKNGQHQFNIISINARNNAISYTKDNDRKLV